MIVQHSFSGTSLKIVQLEVGIQPWRRPHSSPSMGSFKASKIMQQRALTNPKIQVLWNSMVVGAYRDENIENRVLGG